MSVLLAGTQIRDIGLGIKVDKATAALPQSVLGTLFTVSGGGVWVTSIIGVVTTAIQAQATTIQLRATPTTGAVNDLSGTVDINALAAGGLISLTGLAGDAAVKSTGGGVSTLRNPIYVAAGTIGALTGASSTGSVRWMLTYIPYENGASVA